MIGKNGIFKLPLQIIPVVVIRHPSLRNLRRVMVIVI